MTRRTRIARAVFWCGLQVAKLKVPRRCNCPDVDPSGAYVGMKRCGWKWDSPEAAWHLYALSGWIDDDHWEHWAFEHGDCVGVRCSCGGRVCEWTCYEQVER